MAFQAALVDMDQQPNRSSITLAACHTLHTPYSTLLLLLNPSSDLPFAFDFDLQSPLVSLHALAPLLSAHPWTPGAPLALPLIFSLSTCPLLLASLLHHRRHSDIFQLRRERRQRSSPKPPHAYAATHAMFPSPSYFPCQRSCDLLVTKYLTTPQAIVAVRCRDCYLCQDFRSSSLARITAECRGYMDVTRTLHAGRGIWMFCSVDK